MLQQFKPVRLVVVLVCACSAIADQSSPVDSADKNSARYAATVAVDTNLVRKTPGIYTTIDHLAGKYVRNTNCWAAGFNLTCVAVYNSLGMGFSTNGCCPWESASRRAGTLVSPRHLIYAHHYDITAGTKLRFVTRYNMAVTRTLANSAPIPGTDLHVGVLDADVPPGQISFARVLPANFTNYFPTSLASIPALCFNQSQQALVTDIATFRPSISNATMISFAIPADAQRKKFYGDKISGDSGQPAFIIINGQLALLTVWTGGGPGTGNFITHYIDVINAAMQQLGGGYRLTPVDLSRYTRY